MLRLSEASATSLDDAADQVLHNGALVAPVRCDPQFVSARVSLVVHPFNLYPFHAHIIDDLGCDVRSRGLQYRSCFPNSLTQSIWEDRISSSSCTSSMIHPSLRTDSSDVNTKRMEGLSSKLDSQTSSLVCFAGAGKTAVVGVAVYRFDLGPQPTDLCFQPPLHAAALVDVILVHDAQYRSRESGEFQGVAFRALSVTSFKYRVVYRVA